MANIAELPVRVKVKVDLEGGLVIGPDDILAVRVSPRTSCQELDDLKGRLDELLPDIRGRVVIIAAEEFAKVAK